MTDFTELKQKQRATWALGEYDRIADGLTISTDQTLRIAKIRPGERVLDLATGTGITAIAARERGAKVTAVDLTPELLAVARNKAQDEGFGDIEFREGDAEALPFADASFDVVLSTCGHMFAPDQPKVAAELARVTRPGGRIVFLAWTPEGGLAGSALPTSMSRRRPVSRAPSTGAIPRRCANSSAARSTTSRSFPATARSLALHPRTSGSCSRRATAQLSAPQQACRVARWRLFAANCYLS
ncbi:MAG: class I SAM-dependent methyltransferase [Nevskiales bacterium]